MSEWREVTLDEEYDFKSGLSKSRDQFGFGYGFVSFKDVFYNYFIPNELNELANTNEKEQESCSVKRGDVFLTRTSETFNELGMSSVALKDYEKATFNGFTKRLRPVPNSRIWPEYIGYYFRSSYFRKLVTSMATMTTRASLNNEILSRLKVKYPPLPEQKAIAHILGTLDDKIELNQKMNQTLEAMAQALFKSWFVDFDPVFDNALAAGNPIPEVLKAKAERRTLVPDEKKLHHKNPELAEGFPSSFVFNETLDKWIPEGWEVKKLGDVAMPQKGKNITKKDAIPGIFPVVAGGLNPSTYHNQSNTNAPVITISASGANAGYVNLYHNAVWSSDSSFIDNTITDHVYTIYLFLKKNQKPLFEMQEGSAQPHIYPSHISSLEFFVSNKAITEQFEKIVENNFLKIKSSILETETLTQLRDTLLPQLISGKVRVPVG